MSGAFATRTDSTSTGMAKALIDSIAPTVSQMAARYGVGAVDLRCKLLLHLPQFAATDLTDATITSESQRHASAIAHARKGYEHWADGPILTTLQRSDVVVRALDEEAARIVHERFHYIASYRPGMHFAAYWRTFERPFAVATLSPMDVQVLADFVNAGRPTLFLSRVYAFKWAPPNAISYLLGAIRRFFGKQDSPLPFFTWLNPNLGFNASSYRSANWRLHGHYPLTYRYIDGRYVTARQCAELSSEDSKRVQYARFELLPLELWGT